MSKSMMDVKESRRFIRSYCCKMLFPICAGLHSVLWSVREKSQMEIPTIQAGEVGGGRGCQASGKIMAVNKTLGIIYRLSGGRWGSLVKLNILPPERIKH